MTQQETETAPASRRAVKGVERPPLEVGGLGCRPGEAVS